MVLALLLTGCEETSLTAPVAAIKGSVPRRLAQSGITIGCAHVVLGPDLIRGVLTVRNVGPEPLSLVDRWNSFGAYQWFFGGRVWSAGNPKHEWTENACTETVLAPGEVRHARFCIMRSRTYELVPKGDWWFVVGESPVPSVRSCPPIGAFDPGERVTLVMDGSRAGLPDDRPNHTDPLYRGSTSVLSEEQRSVADLDATLLGKPLR
jgi:hypothetical protein